MPYPRRSVTRRTSFVIRYAGVDGKRPVYLLLRDDPYQLMGKSYPTERYHLVGAGPDLVRQSVGTSYDEIYLRRRLSFLFQ